MLTTYQTDGQQTSFSFDWPYLDRSHIMVTVNAAARAFKFIDDHTLKIVDLFGNPFAAGLPLKIFRVTPDLISFAVFKDGANLTADDLNRARLQTLFLIQERSGGIAGSVSQAVQLLTNEIETISGALGSLAETQGVLQAGLQTLNGLGGRVTVVENGAAALLDQIAKEIDDRSAANSALAQRLDSLTVKTANMDASFHSDINLLQSEQGVLASKTDELSARIDNINIGDPEDDGGDALAASIINAAVVSVKKDMALVQKITTLEADLDGNVKAIIQTEQIARVTADEALAKQITTLQSQIGENLAQVIEEIQTKIDATDGKVTGLQAQYTLKTSVKREDGKVVMAGIGLAATANDDYVGSEIILMADKLLFANPNSINGDLVPIFEAGTVDGSATLVIPSTVVGDKTIPGRVLVDGSVEARTIAANTITGDKLVAGSISTDKLQVGLGINLLKNSEFVNLDGWAMASGAGGALNAGRDLASWFPLGGHAAYLQSVGTWPDTSPDVYNGYYYSETLSVLPGTRYEYSAYVGVLRCRADIGLQWLDSAGAVISTDGLGAVSNTRSTVEQAQGGTVLSGYLRLGNMAVAPVNAAGARLLVRKGMNTAGLGTDSWLFFTKAMVAETTTSATRLSPYNPAGLGTLITASGISTPSLSALSANIGLLRTAASGQRLEIDSNQVRVYDSNNVLRVRLGTW